MATKTKEKTITPKSTRYCLFSGEPVKGRKARFLPGYDSKLKSLLIKIRDGNAKINELRPEAKAALKEGLLGFSMKEGKVVGGPVSARPKAAKKVEAKAAAKQKAKIRKAKTAQEVEAAVGASSE